jgi:hypothetical protein
MRPSQAMRAKESFEEVVSKKVCFRIAMLQHDNTIQLRTAVMLYNVQ